MKPILHLIQSSPFFFEKDLSHLHITRLGGWSNTTFKLDFGNESFVLRQNRANRFLDIDRQAEKDSSLLAERIGISASILYAEEDFHVMKFIPNQGSLQPEDCSDVQVLKGIVETLKSLHQSDVPFKKSLNPYERLCKVYQKITKEEGPSLPKQIPLWLKKWGPIFEKTWAKNTHKVNCHNDTTPYNFLKTTDGICVIDWEHSAQNDPAWDLAYLSAEAQLSMKWDRKLLDLYGDEMAEDFRNRFYLYKPLVHLWIFLWIYTQMYSGNQVKSNEEFLEIAQDRFQSWIKTSRLTRVRHESQTVDLLNDKTKGNP